MAAARAGNCARRGEGSARTVTGTGVLGSSCECSSLGCSTVITRKTELFLRTLRDDPADAEVPSHKLLIRAGFVRPVAPGL